MTLNDVAPFALVAVVCFWGFRAGRYAAMIHPLTWPDALAGFVFVLVLASLTMLAPDGTRLIALALYGLAVTIGASRGLRRLEQRRDHHTATR